MSWGCYAHEVDAGSISWNEKLEEITPQNYDPWGRQEEICPFCYEMMFKRLVISLYREFSLYEHESGWVKSNTLHRNEFGEWLQENLEASNNKLENEDFPGLAHKVYGAISKIEKTRPQPPVPPEPHWHVSYFNSEQHQVLCAPHFETEHEAKREMHKIEKIPSAIACYTTPCMLRHIYDQT